MFDVRNTWKILEENKIQYDLTLGYPEMPGFKCGICYPFHVFDIVNKKKLNLIEIPLIIMDVSLMDYLKNIDFEDELPTLDANQLLQEILNVRGRFIEGFIKGNIMIRRHNHVSFYLFLSYRCQNRQN